MATREMKQNLAGAVAFAILPMLLVLKTSTAMLGGPTSAKATVQPTFVISPSGADGLRVPWTEKQEAAAAHIQFLRGQPFAPSPLHRAKVRSSPDQSPRVTVPHLPPLTVQMIMSSSTETVALIDGHRCVVGDTLEGTGWAIVEIDADALTVTLKHARTGQTAVVSVHTPE